MGCLTIQGYLHNSGGLLVCFGFFPSTQLKKFPSLLFIVAWVHHCKDLQGSTVSQINEINLNSSNTIFVCVILLAHCSDPAHPLALYLSDPVASQCYSLSWQKITHWRFRKIIQTDERD